MRTAFLLVLLFTPLIAPHTAAAPATCPTFRAELIDQSLKIGYAVKLIDLNNDGRPDIVVVDKNRVIWFENPGRHGAEWKLHTIIAGATKPDNVCLDVFDIDGDGKLDIALGAGWKPPNTTEPGTIQWLRQPANIDEPWPLYPIGEEPSVHRMRFVQWGDRKSAFLVVAPLQGVATTAKGNWSETGVRLLAYQIPKDPQRDPWKREVIDDNLHAVHNFLPIEIDRASHTFGIVFASYEGLTPFARTGTPPRWVKQPAGGLTGNQEHPDSSRGCSEVKLGRLKNGQSFFTTIEPWHGNQVVVYTQPHPGEWSRHVIDQELKWGHGLWCADLAGDGNDAIIVGVRDALNEKVKSGVNVFTANDDTGSAWTKHVIDNGGVAVEDLACADLDGDGRIDIVAVGRATGNVKIYWNQGPVELDIHLPCGRSDVTKLQGHVLTFNIRPPTDGNVPRVYQLIDGKEREIPLRRPTLKVGQPVPASQPAGLRELLRSQAKDPALVVAIRAEASIPYGAFQMVLLECANAGASNLAFAERPAADPAGADRYLTYTLPIHQLRPAADPPVPAIEPAIIDIRIDLPDAAIAADIPPAARFTARLAGAAYADEASLSKAAADLAARLAADHQKPAEAQVVLNPAAAVRYDTLLLIYEAVRAAGFERVAFSSAH